MQGGNRKTVRTCKATFWLLFSSRSAVHVSYSYPLFFQVGSDPALQQSGHPCLLLPPGPFLFPRHCVIAHTLDPASAAPVVTITPSDRDAETFVNQKRIFDTTILQVAEAGCGGS